ncbi:hypothetical protein E3H47_13140 [Acinetobacter radioresistens]|uniref:AAA family ATPase n=1 Tax=Acinetobacter radioresistens TaxID=40216 RepID=UPI0010CCF524|nr:AAA family ATPase [Acinetobacter radioresistens]QCS13384.1 hypothetical protein E3H47_13140 [Acinetobacter radioresistens]
MNNLYIEKLQIEGGFLDGLNIELKNDLNTIIGARGTGKSTFIELIRYCLDIKGQSSESHSKSVAHARSVLKDGQVSITLNDGSNSYEFSRTAYGDTIPPIPTNLKMPLIFSQTEIENIGLVSQGRLKLIDDFLHNINTYETKELSIIAQINSISDEITSLSTKVEDNQIKLIQLKYLNEQLDILANEEKSLTTASTLTKENSNKLEKASKESLNLLNKIDYLTYRLEKNDAITEYLESISFKIDNYPDIDKDTPSEFDKKIDDGENYVRLAINKLKEGSTLLRTQIHSIESKLIFNKQEEKILRLEIESYHNGTGEILRKMQRIKEEISKLKNVSFFTNDYLKNLKTLKEHRNILINNLQEVRSSRSEKRLAVCQDLTKNLSPKITITLEQESHIDEYYQVIVNSLKGSGIQYNDIAHEISRRIPPLVLAKIIEENNDDLFLSLIEISKSRAQKIISTLKDSIHLISTAKLEDEVTFQLQDESTIKDFSDLSTGQRCTVILPIILEHKNLSLVIDQPEDHIDNAFIVDTLISSLQRRSQICQTIITTHNANIPVLGNAKHVIYLKSDGSRGYITAEGLLRSRKIIDAISTVMEGGRTAFKFRAEFYD